MTWDERYKLKQDLYDYKAVLLNETEKTLWLKSLEELLPLTEAWVEKMRRQLGESPL